MSKIHDLVGHECSNSNRDSRSQTEPTPAESTTPPLEQRESGGTGPSGEKDDTHFFWEARGVPGWITTVFASIL